ncbi:MAG TPA: cation:proton antiporter [Candidatus Limnocylindrales bacterium]|nr:cation:proton antiporter [Candidatus Limnocylindrales bacterium]
METGVAAFALLLAGYALIANRLDDLSIGPALAFVVVGLVLGPAVLDVLPVGVGSTTVRHLAEVTLALVLFTDASTVHVAGLRRDTSLIGRLLVIGLLLTIAAGGLVATLIFPDLPLATALLIGAILAPTDAALGLPVISNPAVPTRIRRILNVESGLNDGIATPFVLLFIALATAAGGAAGGHLEAAVVEIAIAIIVGSTVGGLGGLLLARADERDLTSELSRQIAVLALAVSGYFVSVALGGNGFVAAFLAGLAFGTATRHMEERAELFSEAAGILLSIGVWTIFGATLVGSLIHEIGDLRPILYAVLSLTVIRMVPVAIALAGSRLALPTIGFIGWFGPRGLASIVFGILAVDALAQAGVPAGPIASTVAWTVLLSVVAHGLTAGALADRYGRWIARRQQASPVPLPELEERSEPRPTTRSSWIRRREPSSRAR